MPNTHVQGDTEVAIDVELSNKNFCLDDPEQRQHYTKYMSAFLKGSEHNISRISLFSSMQNHRDLARQGNLRPF